MHRLATQASQNHLDLKRELFECSFEFFRRRVELLGAFAKRLHGLWRAALVVC